MEAPQKTSLFEEESIVLGLIFGEPMFLNVFCWSTFSSSRWFRAKGASDAVRYRHPGMGEGQCFLPREDLGAPHEVAYGPAEEGGSKAPEIRGSSP